MKYAEAIKFHCEHCGVVHTDPLKIAAPEMYEVLSLIYDEMSHFTTEQFEMLHGEKIEKILDKIEGK